MAMSQKELYEAFGKAVSVRRNKLRMTQAELARKVGLSRASLANIENARQNVLLHHVYSLAVALKFSKIAELLPPDPQLVADDQMQLHIDRDQVSDREKALVGDLIATALEKRSPTRARP